MADPAIKPMTLDEFFYWDDGTETHYELIGGFRWRWRRRLKRTACSPYGSSRGSIPHSPVAGRATRKWKPGLSGRQGGYLFRG